MALPSPHPDRTLKHRRRIEVEIYACGNGLWEVDAHLTDTKAFDWQLHSGLRAAGTPIHQMTLRLKIDESFNILDAGSQSSFVAYPGHCETHGSDGEDGDAYQRLIGLNLVFGFAAAVKQRLAGVLGCTHITELTRVLPTAVIQGFAGTVKLNKGEPDSEQRPFQLDRCHALRADSDAVRIYYPRWHSSAQNTAPEPAGAQTASPSASAGAPGTADSPDTPGSHQARG